MNYLSAATKKAVPNRKTRKGLRFKTFTTNKTMRKKLKKSLSLSRRESLSSTSAE
jgi:hypothetical protein